MTYAQKFLILNRGEDFRGREGIIGACLPSYSLCFFFLPPLSFSKLCYSFFFTPSVLILFVVIVVLCWLSTMHGGSSFYTAYRGWFFTILHLNCFCLGVGVLPNHPLVCQLPSHHHLPVLAVPHPITRQRILFCLLVHLDIPIKIKVSILSHCPSWHAPSDSNSSFPLLGGMSSQQDISPKRVWARTPK